jgi:hypothetical protein
VEEQIAAELRSESPIHLVVLWTVTPDYNLADEIYLVYPSVNSSGRVGEVWRVLLTRIEDQSQIAFPGTTSEEWDDDLDIQSLDSGAQAAE